MTQPTIGLGLVRPRAFAAISSARRMYVASVSMKIPRKALSPSGHGTPHRGARARPSRRTSRAMCPAPSTIRTVTVGLGIAPSPAPKRSRAVPPIGNFTLPRRSGSLLDPSLPTGRSTVKSLRTTRQVISSQKRISRRAGGSGRAWGGNRRNRLRELRLRTGRCAAARCPRPCGRCGSRRWSQGGSSHCPRPCRR